MNARELKVNDWVFLYFPQNDSFEFVKVVNVDTDANCINVQNENGESIRIAADAWRQISGIPLSENLLRTLLDFLKLENATIYGLVGQTLYERCYERNGVSLSICLNYEDNHFSVIEAGEGFYGCETTPVSFLHELQHLFYEMHGIEMPINLF